MIRAQTAPALNTERLIDLYIKMLRIRLVEEAIAEHYGEGEMRCPVHLSIGQEAIAVGVCEALKVSDKVYSTHRCHAHYLAKGGDLKRMMAEIYGKEAGCIGGRGGSMHLADAAKGMMASIPIVSSSIPVAVGSALADKRCTGKVTVAASAMPRSRRRVYERPIYRSTLPVIFVCENNLYSVYTPLRQRQPDRPLTDVARAHGVPAVHGDGNSVEDCYRLAKEDVARALNDGGPTFLLLDSYRWREHCGPGFDNHIGYRTEEEYQQWAQRCPVRRLRDRIAGALPPEEEKAMVAEIAAEIEDARTFAHLAPLPDPSQASLHVYA
jgi:pyruvate dehydrogenase E1 component alpha subunit